MDNSHRKSALNPSPAPEAKDKEREGLILDFVLEDDYLITHTLSGMSQNCFVSGQADPNVVAFQNYAWDMNRGVYEFISGKHTVEQVVASYGSLQQLNKELSHFLTQLKQSPAYQRIRQQTQEYIKYCRSQWQTNYPQTQKVLNELTGLDLDRRFTVSVTHPSLKNGAYAGNHRIVWGGKRNDFPNYETVYLAHEIMHSYLDRSDQGHAIIQLVTDNELRTRLNGGDYPPFVGHSELFPLMERLLPEWNAYKVSGKGNILEFQEQVKRITPPTRE